MFKVVSEDHSDDDNDNNVSMQRITSRIKEEIRKMTKIKTEYNTFNTKNLFDECSSILITFLSKLSPSFDKSLNAAMIGAILTSVLTISFTQLQLALGILVHDKKLIQHLHEYGITSTYHEVRRSKISAAAESDEKGEERQSLDGLIQVVSDNFGVHIYSQSGLK